MSDGQHYATFDDLAAATGFALPMYTVGPASSGAVYTTVEEGVTAAGTDIDAGTITSALVLAAPGTYLEDVTITASGITVAGFGGPSDVIIRSLTWSDASAASITAFNASGTFTDLADGTYNTPPVIGGVENVTLFRDAAAPAWAGPQANASLRLLGFDTAAGTFLQTRFIVSNCRILKAGAAAAGQGGIHGCYGNVLEVKHTLITGGCLFEQYASKNFFNSPMLGTGVFDDTFNSAGTIPGTAYAATILFGSDIAGEIELNGDVADFQARNCYIGSIDDNCTAAGSASTVEDCHIAGAIDNANANATMTITGGSTEVAVTGAGAASVTISTQKLASDMVPLADDSVSIGSSTMRVAAVNATSFSARADAGDTQKTVITASSIAAKGNNHSIRPSAAANDVAGYSETLQGGSGGNASVGAGQTGGASAVVGGQGGAGTGALLAGAGGDATITGGAGGANGGAGGNDGGDVVLAAGNASGAGTDGDVKIGLTNTEKIETGANIQSDAANTDHLGLSTKRWASMHATEAWAHADDTSTNYAKLTATGLALAGSNFAVSVAKGAADTAGFNHSNTAGAGGDASAAPAGAGGTNSVVAGVGGDGTAALAAGAGGNAYVTAGAAGVAGAGGGAAGGHVVLTAGAPSGGLVPGRIQAVSAVELLDIALAGRAALGLSAGVGNGTLIYCTNAGPGSVAIPLFWDASGAGQWRDAAGAVVA